MMGMLPFPMLVLLPFGGERIPGSKPDDSSFARATNRKKRRQRNPMLAEDSLLNIIYKLTLI